MAASYRECCQKAISSSDSKEVVKLSMGVVATLAALVLGLLVASAKSTYDARESEINQITASKPLSLVRRLGMSDMDH